MDRVNCCGQDSQVDNARSAAMDEYQPAEITVASDEDLPILLRYAQQLGVVGLRSSKGGDGLHAMSEIS
jgi:hypothetical protein